MTMNTNISQTKNPDSRSGWYHQPIAFSNHPNLLIRDNYLCTKLQNNLELQVNIGMEYFSVSLSFGEIV